MSRLLPTLLALLLALPLPACAKAGLEAGPGPTGPLATPARWHAVLVAGDGSLPVWDNAVEGLAPLLGPGAVVRRLSADPGQRAEPATLDRVLRAVAALRPGPGEGCLVFVTAHGAPREGVMLVPSNSFLTPAALDAALAEGCGAAPTVAIVSACYSGTFAQAPMARPNRVVLTAARPDRPSFGCGAGRTYTVFDECLLGALRAGGDWNRAATATTDCVTRAEARLGETPSGPQRWLGAQVAGLGLPVPGAQPAPPLAGPAAPGGGKFGDLPPAPAARDKFRVRG